MKTIKIISLLLFGITLAFLWQRNPSPKNKPAQNELVMGIAAGYAPFISLNEEGEYEGFDIDIAKAVAKKLNKTLILKDMGSMAPLLMAIDQNQVDAIIWGLEMTQARLSRFAMINYQGEPSVTYPLVFWKIIPENILTLKDLDNKLICVEPSSAQADILLRKYPLITVRPTERVDDALLALQYQKADAAFVEPAIAKKWKQKFNDVKILDIKLDKEDQVEGIGIGISKSNNILIGQITKAVAELKKDGTIKALEEKWGLA